MVRDGKFLEILAKQWVKRATLFGAFIALLAALVTCFLGEDPLIATIFLGISLILGLLRYIAET